MPSRRHFPRSAMLEHARRGDTPKSERKGKIVPGSSSAPAAKPQQEFRDKRQVELDLARVPLSKAGVARLGQRVGTVLAANPELHYYQGFHDIAMHTHSEKQLENLALQQLRDFMAESMLPTQHILRLVPQLLLAADSNGVGRIFATKTVSSGADEKKRGKAAAAAVDPALENPALLGFFAVAPIVTLFSHHIDDSLVIAPIIRNVLKEGLAYVIYLYAALVLDSWPTIVREHLQSRSRTSLEQGSTNGSTNGSTSSTSSSSSSTRSTSESEKVPIDEEEVEIIEDFFPVTETEALGDEAFMLLQGVPERLTHANFARLDAQARQLRQRVPLRSLPAFKAVSRHSVLKTGKITRRATAAFTLTQLDRSAAAEASGSDGGLLGGLHVGRVTSRFMVMAVAVGALAVGVMWTTREAAHR